MYVCIYIRNQEIVFVVVVVMCVVIYKNLLLIHLQGCVLKLVSELHDFILFGS